MGRLMVLLFALAVALHGQPSSAAGDRMLVFTRTAGYRHDSIPAAVAAIRDLAARHGIEVDHTEDAGVFRPDDLARFKAVGFVNTTGNVLDREQQRAFEAFVEAGGGYLGIHSAADTGYDWPWYRQLLGGEFKSHPPGLQTGVVRFARPLGAPAPIAWRVTDEFYDFASRPSGEATVIARLDESTYEGGQMGAEHPIAWCRKVHGGRSWYTGLGHRPELFADPVFLAHLDKGVRYTMSRSEDC
jgi:uncharacterized protein